VISTLEFEKPIVELEKKISELKHLSSDGNLNLQSEVKKLESRLAHVKKETYAQLTPWQRVQIARHPKRPYTLDYIRMIFTDFIELHGDRTFADDRALIGGFAKLDGQSFLVIGDQKGRDAKENIMRNKILLFLTIFVFISLSCQNETKKRIEAKIRQFTRKR